MGEIDKDKLYEIVAKILERDNNVEIRKGPQGVWQISEVKKKKILL